MNFERIENKDIVVSNEMFGKMITEKTNSISLYINNREVAFVSFSDELVFIEDDLTFDEFFEVSNRIKDIIEKYDDSEPIVENPKDAKIMTNKEIGYCSKCGMYNDENKVCNCGNKKLVQTSEGTSDGCPICTAPACEDQPESSLHIWETRYECGTIIQGAIGHDEYEFHKKCYEKRFLKDINYD